MRWAVLSNGVSSPGDSSRPPLRTVSRPPKSRICRFCSDESEDHCRNCTDLPVLRRTPNGGLVVRKFVEVLTRLNLQSVPRSHSCEFARFGTEAAFTP